jgi:tetratricopeptide (TPR) repeat protein
LAWLWAAIEVAPYLRLAPFASANAVADRYLYGAAAGLCLLLVWSFEGRRGRLALGVLAMIWAALTIRRNGVFLDETALAEQTAACAPEHPAAQVMLGMARLKQGAYVEARGAFLRATALDAEFPVQWNNLAIAEYFMGDYDASIRDFRRAIALSDDAGLRNNLGNALAARKRYGEALAEYEQASRLRPGWKDPLDNQASVRRLMHGR